ncbi:hypothetical protein CC1G_11194 [Coprinopsis cinerea okayama7|uniref:Phytocyanin domain-containing protein n=1 Tax=Coprinopsis cinerea (strain Okayama-7 / 130 / ATCC MYA-4618 / FGSC 9003) TaxID=240176 RepID=A8NJS5_COPC7|nr:hypothetical protein CC1G_11194 [Coprinopsis cinerea okayama7\|eukprot:XP_001834281.1 hypothetical protein CC1G_11194 [Coprinopsis cinerea okayama7\
MQLLTAVLLGLSTSTAVLGAEYRVGVGKDETTGRKGKGFDPSVIHPIAGDVIAFEFRSGAHSAVQSEFDNPCVYNGGFNSGVFTVADDLHVDAPGLPIVRVTVNSTEPLWFFDEAGGLCHQGAVLAVNPTSQQTDVQFKLNAAQPPKPASYTNSPSHSKTAGGEGPSQAVEDVVTEEGAAVAVRPLGVGVQGEGRLSAGFKICVGLGVAYGFYGLVL